MPRLCIANEATLAVLAVTHNPTIPQIGTYHLFEKERRAGANPRASLSEGYCYAQIPKNPPTMPRTSIRTMPFIGVKLCLAKR